MPHGAGVPGAYGARDQPAKSQRALVVVQLDGGNDALNASSRTPTRLCQAPPRLKINPKMRSSSPTPSACHPQLRPLDKLLQAGSSRRFPRRYPNPNRSHFRSMAIWQTARFDPEEHSGYGWIGRALDADGGQAILAGTTACRWPCAPAQLGHRAEQARRPRLADRNP